MWRRLLRPKREYLRLLRSVILRLRETSDEGKEQNVNGSFHFLLSRGLMDWLEGVQSLDYSYFPLSVSRLAHRSIAR
jgi:hypothetical protein